VKGSLLELTHSLSDFFSGSLFLHFAAFPGAPFINFS
jgi:hypothetical protein